MQQPAEQALPGGGSSGGAGSSAHQGLPQQQHGVERPQPRLQHFGAGLQQALTARRLGHHPQYLHRLVVPPPPANFALKVTCGRTQSQMATGSALVGWRRCSGGLQQHNDSWDQLPLASNAHSPYSAKRRVSCSSGTGTARVRDEAGPQHTVRPAGTAAITQHTAHSTRQQSRQLQAQAAPRRTRQAKAPHLFLLVEGSLRGVHAVALLGVAGRVEDADLAGGGGAAG